MMKVLPAVAAAFGLMTVAAGSASATVVFTENFNSYVTSYSPANSSQAITGLPVEAYGSVTGWTSSGPGALHGVDRGNGTGDWAVMFYDDNVMSRSGILANDGGSNYLVTFDGAPGAYNNAGQASGALDFVRFLLTDGNNAVVATYDYFPGAFPAGSNNSFSSGSFSYIGTGNGNLTLSMSDPLADSQFGGAIDNLQIAVPEPASMMLLASGLIGAGLVRRRAKANNAAV